MSHLVSFYRKFGGWLYLTGLLVLFLSFSYLESYRGYLFLAVGAILALSDPLVLFIGRGGGGRRDSGQGGTGDEGQRREGGGVVQQGQGDAQRREEYRALLFAWGMGLLSVTFFMLRRYLSVPAAGADEGSMVLRLQRLLLALYLLLFVGSVVYRIALGLGASAVSAISSSLREQKQRYLRSTVFSIFAAIPLFVLANYASSIWNPVLDLTPGYFSFTANAKTVIRSIRRPVEVYAFLPSQQAVRSSGRTYTLPELYRISEDVRVMLEQLPVINASIKINYYNAELDTDRVADFGTVNNGTIIFRSMKPAGDVKSGEKPYVERRIYVTAERDLDTLERESVRSLIQVSAPEKTLYFTTMNGERFNFSDQARKPGGIEILKQELGFYNFRVKALNAESGWPGSVPADADALFIAGPTVPFGTQARDAIRNYLDRKGRLFVAVDSQGGEDFSWLLEMLQSDYRFRRAVLSDVPSLPGVVVTDDVAPHRITENLNVAGRSTIVFPEGGYLAVEPAAKSAQTMKGAVQGSTKSAPNGTPAGKSNGATSPPSDPLAAMKGSVFLNAPFSTILDTNRNGKKDPGEETGRRALGIAFETPQKEKGPMVVLYSGVQWLTDGGLSFPVEQRNIILAADSMFWLTESPLAASLVAETRKSRRIQVTDEMKFRNMLFGMVLFPLMTGILVAGGVYYHRRRRKFIGEI